MALGRSGTQFLAHLLDRAPNVCFRHEPFPADRQLLGLARAGVFDTVLEGTLHARFRPERLAIPPNTQVYGESNSYLRYFPDWLRTQLHASLVHVVRDGRAFVRSAHARATYTAYERVTPIVPRDDDPAARHWGQWTRFARLCWYWNHTNRFLLDHVEHRAQFERLTSDYPYFTHRLLEPLALHVPEPQWRDAVARPLNTTRRTVTRAKIRRIFHRSTFQPAKDIGPWSAWSSEQRDQFWDICGETMEALGYDV